MTGRNPTGGRGSNQYQTRGSGRVDQVHSGEITKSLGELTQQPAQRVSTQDPELVAAREVVLDTVETLRPHSRSLTLIGAQAVYERTQDLVIEVAATTTDGDFSIDPALLADSPPLGDAMRTAGFIPFDGSRPGIWTKPVQGTPITVDLIVPDLFAGSGKRGARLPSPHGQAAAGRAKGVELTVIDRDMLTVSTFDPDTPRQVDVYVAGVAALLCAKAYKLTDRLNDHTRQDRIRPKDAGDMWRLFATTDPTVVSARFDELAADPRVGQIAETGRGYIADLFTPTGKGTGLVFEAFANAEPENRILNTINAWMDAFNRHA